MSEFKKATPKNLDKVFANCLIWFENYPEDAKLFCKDFNKLLDEYLGMDIFGTEGQSDPRGDHRS